MKRIVDETGINEGDLVIYRNKSDYGHLFEKQHRVLRIIPFENMSNSSSDCAEIEMEPKVMRKDHALYNDMTEEDYAEENEGKDPKDHKTPESLVGHKQITTLNHLVSLKGFDTLKELREAEVKTFIEDGQKALLDGTFGDWVEANLKKFNLKTK